MYYVVEYFGIVLFLLYIFFSVILYNLIVTFCKGEFEPWKRGLSYMPLGGIKLLHV